MVTPYLGIYKPAEYTPTEPSTYNTCGTSGKGGSATDIDTLQRIIPNAYMPCGGLDD